MNRDYIKRGCNRMNRVNIFLLWWFLILAFLGWEIEWLGSTPIVLCFTWSRCQPCQHFQDCQSPHTCLQLWVGWELKCLFFTCMSSSHPLMLTVPRALRVKLGATCCKIIPYNISHMCTFSLSLLLKRAWASISIAPLNSGLCMNQTYTQYKKSEGPPGPDF